ncbi:MAG: zinc-dependent metalloprotease [Desertimonas sp.]
MADNPDERPEPFDPFANLPMFGEMSRALSGQGPLNWDAARQFALLGATGGTPEANVDPAVRVTLEELARLVWFHVADVLGRDGGVPSFEVTTRTDWARGTLEAYRHLFTELATALGPTATGDGADAADAGDPMMAMMAGLSKMMAPAMLGMGVGSMVGRLSARAFGTHDLPIPRQPASIALVPGNVDEFAQQWEIPGDEMRLWVLAHELAGHVLLTSPAVAEPLAALVREHVAGFRPDPGAVADRLGEIDIAGGDPMTALQSALGDPEVLLGAVTSPEQQALRPRLDALVSTVVGATDWVVDAVAVRLVGGNALRIAEAVRRRRAETSANDRFIEQLLGIRIGDDQVGRGKSFVQGIVDRVGERGLEPLLSRADAAPTPAEVAAPGLWLARLESPPTDR